jgi:Protein kinase domain.
MPKVIDVYVLDNKIGSGQFGDVYYGYSKIDGTSVAIKAMNRIKN